MLLFRHKAKTRINFMNNSLENIKTLLNTLALSFPLTITACGGDSNSEQTPSSWVQDACKEKLEKDKNNACSSI